VVHSHAGDGVKHGETGKKVTDIAMGRDDQPFEFQPISL